MTYIEFFDKTAAENISACLTFAPERVIYIGDDSKLIQQHIANYRRVFLDRGISIEFLYRIVSKSNLQRSIEILSELVETYDDCVFDITGGEEILTLALGVVYGRYPDKNIQIHKFNLRNNAVYDCDKDGTTIYRNPPTLSIEENVRIYGGDIIYGNINEDNTYKWDMSPDFIKDIELIWNVCKGNVRYWNMQIGILEAIEKVGAVSENGLTTVAKLDTVKTYLVQHKSKYKPAHGILNYLLKNHLITLFDDGDEMTVTVSYKNAQVKKCLTKAGQALEMKVYSTARSVVDKEGVPVYDDALNGVVIDWDGKAHDEETEDVYDTENEIDILLMHDVVPVFISCKNGVVTSDELYKLNTVAERFGGKYSKKVLVATSVSDMGETGKYLRQRANDMNIKLIDNVQEFSDAKFAKELKNLWCV